MKSEEAKTMIQRLLSAAGVEINGQHSWDIQIHNEKFYTQALLGGSLRVGEAYVAKWWDCSRLDEFFNRILRNSIDQQLPKQWSDFISIVLSRLANFQTIRRSLMINRHYNLGNNLFSKMLDERMIYTCAYWKDARSLDEAQVNKLDLTCRKLYLQPGMKVLDVGCGWGGLAKYAAEHYQVQVTGITLSEEQATYAREMCKGLPVDIQLLDYRNLRGQYDRIVSLGMFEHVGYKNYRTFMRMANNHLTDNGLFLLHTIGNNTSATHTDPWIDRYIFPNSLLPSVLQIAKAAEHLFVVEDWHNFSADYDKTLMAWYQNFTAHWDELKADYDEDFYRLWAYYLLSCAGSFRARKNQLWQIVFSKNGLPGGYVSIR